MPRTLARVRLVGVNRTLGADLLTDAAEIEVVQYNRVLIECPGNPAADYELTTPLPNDVPTPRTSPIWPIMSVT